jgi:putative ABC transport system permease protein
MKYLPLIWAGLWRKRARTVLTLLSVAVAFLLFGLLDSVTASLDDVVERIGEERLRTMSRVNLLEPIPLAYLPLIESVPGVEKVASYSIFFGYLQEPTTGIGVGAISAEVLRGFSGGLDTRKQRTGCYGRAPAPSSGS